MTTQHNTAHAGRYLWQVVFIGNRGKSFAPYDKLHETKAAAKEAARAYNGSGLRYGAHVRRVHVKPT